LIKCQLRRLEHDKVYLSPCLRLRPNLRGRKHLGKLSSYSSDIRKATNQAVVTKCPVDIRTASFLHIALLWSKSVRRCKHGCARLESTCSTPWHCLKHFFHDVATSRFNEHIQKVSRTNVKLHIFGANVMHCSSLFHCSRLFLQIRYSSFRCFQYFTKIYQVTAPIYTSRISIKSTTCPYDSIPDIFGQ
jgi:hypothetical protein